jgi:hypothetical protein
MNADNKRAVKCIAIGTAILEFLVLSLILGGCRTVRYVEVEKVRTDTIYENHTTRDSIYLHDSIHVKEWQKGDTIWVEKVKWVTKWEAHLTHDTIYRATHDTIPKPYPVIKTQKVEKELNWWQRMRMTVGDIALFALALILVVWLVKAVIIKLVRP